jgi:hypothetical protein
MLICSHMYQHIVRTRANAYSKESSRSTLHPTWSSLMFGTSLRLGGAPPPEDFFCSAGNDTSETSRILKHPRQKHQTEVSRVTCSVRSQNAPVAGDGGRMEASYRRVLRPYGRLRVQTHEERGQDECDTPVRGVDRERVGGICNGNDAYKGSQAHSACSDAHV